MHRSGSLDRTIAPFFVTWCNYRLWFCVEKALWRWFYPRSRKKDHFQTLATGVPKLKTWLGTQRVKVGPPTPRGYFSHLVQSFLFFVVVVQTLWICRMTPFWCGYTKVNSQKSKKKKKRHLLSASKFKSTMDCHKQKRFLQNKRRSEDLQIGASDFIGPELRSFSRFSDPITLKDHN